MVLAKMRSSSSVVLVKYLLAGVQECVKVTEEERT
jgi:hypothetical protein